MNCRDNKTWKYQQPQASRCTKQSWLVQTSHRWDAQKNANDGVFSLSKIKQLTINWQVLTSGFSSNILTHVNFSKQIWKIAVQKEW